MLNALISYLLFPPRVRSPIRVLPGFSIPPDTVIRLGKQLKGSTLHGVFIDEAAHTVWVAADREVFRISTQDWSWRVVDTHPNLLTVSKRIERVLWVENKRSSEVVIEMAGCAGSVDCLKLRARQGKLPRLVFA
jgi:hypothetical protein